MKKLLLILAISVAVISCCGFTFGKKEKETETETEFVAKEEVGEGTAYLKNASGTTEDDNVILIFHKKGEKSMSQIGLCVRDLDGSLLTFAYVDRDERVKNQFKDADWSIKLDYSKGDFDEGIHNVEVIQYQDNDPEKEILFYRTMQYEVQDI